MLLAFFCARGFSCVRSDAFLLSGVSWSFHILVKNVVVHIIVKFISVSCLHEFVYTPCAAMVRRSLWELVMSLSADAFSQIGEALYGSRWTSALARDLGVSYRAVLNWRQGVVPLPDDIVKRLRPIVRRRVDAVEGARALLWSKADA